MISACPTAITMTSIRKSWTQFSPSSHFILNDEDILVGHSSSSVPLVMSFNKSKRVDSIDFRTVSSPTMSHLLPPTQVDAHCHTISPSRFPFLFWRVFFLFLNLLLFVWTSPDTSKRHSIHSNGSYIWDFIICLLPSCSLLFVFCCSSFL